MTTPIHNFRSITPTHFRPITPNEDVRSSSAPPDITRNQFLNKLAKREHTKEMIEYLCAHLDIAIDVFNDPSESSETKRELRGQLFNVLCHTNSSVIYDLFKNHLPGELQHFPRWCCEYIIGGKMGRFPDSCSDILNRFVTIQDSVMKIKRLRQLVNFDLLFRVHPETIATLLTKKPTLESTMSVLELIKGGAAMKGTLREGMLRDALRINCLHKIRDLVERVSIEELDKVYKEVVQDPSKASLIGCAIAAARLFNNK